MPTHDIIDNRERKLGEVHELRLLIGNTINRETLEQIAEGYRRLEMVADAAEAQAYPKRAESRQMAAETAGNIRGALEVMDQTEDLNEEAMYAIYGPQQESQTELWETDDRGALLDLNEAEEILRQLRSDDPAEDERIASLRDGIRSAKPSASPGTFVFCQAGRFQQLFLLGGEGEIVSRDVPRILAAIRCEPELPAAELPRDYNATVMRVKRRFIEEVKHRQSEREHSLSLTHGQRYVLRELRVLFGAAEDKEKREQINLLEKTFRAPLTTALKKELNGLRRNSIAGEDLLAKLIDLYLQHNLKDWIDRRQWQREELEIPRVVCSEALA